LIDAIKSGNNLNLDAHEEMIKATVASSKTKNDNEYATETDLLITQLQENQKRTLTRIVKGKCSAWLTIIPNEDNQFMLSPHEFRDSIALRYAKSPVGLQGHCDGCGKAFSVSHALDCKNGGLVYGRHNESQDLNIDLLSMAGLKQILREPVIKESGQDGEGELRADWSARGFWETQKVALFDICIFNADAPSYKNSSLEALFTAKRNLKKKMYCQAAESRRASFTPIIATYDAIFDREALAYFKRLASILSQKWGLSYSATAGWLNARIQICILRSTSMCLRGSRSKWRGAGLEDGAGVNLALN
jgi:hypothetical protein